MSVAIIKTNPFYQHFKGHKKIGIDFDETLIDHPNSHYLQEFIIAEHKKRQFWIVTHRCDSWMESLGEDLEDGSFGTVTEQMFVGVHGVPAGLYRDFCLMQYHGKKIDVEHSFYLWKGKICKELGITILADDNASLNEYGCQKAGIKFLNMHRT